MYLYDVKINRLDVLKLFIISCKIWVLYLSIYMNEIMQHLIKINCSVLLYITMCLN